ncbi:bifunctional riboflavin kinase/FAD synthetase [Methylocapsa sp. S129]|uniref:bifunctional riboflavin kinase/FAD synthetase n=1 Tax=Methylocapsa sp. S129 TaxID=1641869 RepID=UPI001FEDF566|nr:bifunctional riboflavin kinase/FAD synthetase [Methylocapsa sp. S129]
MPPASPPRKFLIAVDPQTPPAGLERAVLAIGNFDGAHLGHRAVIGRTKRLAAELGAPSAVLTFEPHPADFFAGKPVVFRLTPKAVKARALEEFGLDGAIILTFDAHLAALSAEEFVSKVLVERLDVAAIVIGWDFHFGKGRSGSPAFLREAGVRYGFRVDIIDKVEAAETAQTEAISSTAIRRALEAGDVEGAARLLGRDYAIVGTVIPGQKLGRTLGVPTANIALEPSNRLAHGIYAVEVFVDGVRFGGVASFGTRPTVDDGAPLLETFLFDFDGDLYGRAIEVAFVRRIRGEQKFDSLDALVAEMGRDKEKARAILAERAASA